MKISLALFILAFNTTISFSQNADSLKSTNKNQSRFSVGVFGTALYDYQLVSVDRHPSSYEVNAATNKEKGEKGRFAFSTGVGATYAVSKKVSIECDLMYSIKGYQQDLDKLIFGDMIDPRFGFIYQTQNISLKKWTYNYNYLDVPLKFYYSVPGRKLQEVISIGIVPNFLLSATETLINEDTDGNQTSTQLDNHGSFNSFGLSGYFGFSFLYNINQHFRILMGPDFQYSFTNLLDTETKINVHLWSAGLNIGTFYRF